MFFLNKRIAALCILGACIADATSVFAQTVEQPIGYVMSVKGDVSVTTAGVVVPAVVGTPIALGSELITGANASMGVTLRDNTVMSFGPNTRLSLDEFQFAPAKGDLKLSTRISRGTMNFISGVIAKLKPEAVLISTPTGTIGVRGTHFLVKVES